MRLCSCTLSFFTEPYSLVPRALTGAVFSISAFVYREIFKKFDQLGLSNKGSYHPKM